MFLLEHDAKSLLASAGAVVPPGTLVDQAQFSGSLPPGPWMVKAQLAAGGRGKAGLIRKADSAHQVVTHVSELLGATHNGKRVLACRVESRIADCTEAYLSLMVDPVSGGVHVTLADRGGIEIEALAETDGGVRGEIAAPTAQAVMSAVTRLTAGYPLRIASALIASAQTLVPVFFDYELLLLEINPLFVDAQGGWIAGDAKIINDNDVMYRQTALRQLLEQRSAAYPETWYKHVEGCDLVIVDAEGETGLLTTGAGLSMMLIDELHELGLKPYNFLDVRTSGLRGDPTRLIHVLEQIAMGPRVRVLLVNIFAGITDLAEFSRLLVEALRRTPRFTAPVVARLVGTNFDIAREFLAAHDIPVVTELDVALDRVKAVLGR